MEEETQLQRFHRECPFTYEQLYANLYANVEFFCQSHDLPIDAANVFAEDWVNNWEQLVDLHEFLVVEGMVDCEAENVANEAYVQKMVEVTSTLCRLIVQNSDVELRSDGTRLEDLRINAQLIPGHADGSNNNCLVESLITVLTEAGFLEHMTVSQRQSVCKWNRIALVYHDDVNLHPADEHGNECRDAYLEHDKHAEPTVRYLCFSSGLWKREKGIPENGFKLIVYSRADCEQLPPNVVHICRSAGSGAEPHPLYLYNYLGERLRGVHYVPMHMLQVLPPMQNVEEDIPVPPVVAERKGATRGSTHGKSKPSALGNVCVAAYATCGGSSCGHAKDSAADENARRKRALQMILGGGA